MTGLFTPPAALRPLRPHQERALEASRASLAAGKRRPMLQAPTGFGKTLLAAHIIRRALDKGKRVAFTVPAISLIDQTVAAFEAEGISCVGVVQGIHERTDRDQPVQVCSVQTIARRQRPDVNLVLVDEAHQLHREIFRWMADSPDLPFIGLSATPWARGLGKYYDDLIIAATIAELIEARFLSPFVVYAPSQPDLEGVRTVAGDFDQSQLGDAVDQPRLVADVIETWRKRGGDRPTLCYGVNRAHAEHLQQRLVEAGIVAEYMDGETRREDREGTFGRFRSGQTRVICNVGVLTTGVDLDVRCIIDAKPTKSEMLFVQTIGRGLRVAPGKTDCLILDHAGNHLRLGMVTDIHQDHLDDGTSTKDKKREAKERAEPLPKLCDECKAVISPKAKECPGCGAPVLTRTEVKHGDGELVELGARRSGKIEPTITDKAIFYAELRGYAAARRYTDGWIAHKYRERFGVWPNDPRVKSSPPISPSLSTRNWITSRNIAWARRWAG
jgi:superfamily II DNA or RNA helicase